MTTVAASAPAGRRVSTRIRPEAALVVPTVASTYTARHQRASPTPPLTPDFAADSISDCESVSTGEMHYDNDQEHSEHYGDRQRSPPTAEFLDVATLAYMSRCHADVPLNFSCSQEEWSWDRLRLPSFLEPDRYAPHGSGRSYHSSVSASSHGHRYRPSS